MPPDLSAFWEVLETNFPLAGPRRDLRERLGPDLVAALEAGGHLSYLRVADVVACPHPGGVGCPRQVIDCGGGAFRAACGNEPPECEDIDLRTDDVEVIGVDPMRLCEALRRPLSTGGKVEPIAGLWNVYRAGTFKPDTLIRHPVYFVARCGAREYAEAFDALRSHHDGDGMAILVPTDRFVGADTTRQMATLGVPIISLSETIDIDVSGQLTSAVNSLHLFARVGRRGAAAAGATFAEALTPSGWRSLDEAAYRRLIESVDDYAIVADERSRVVWKRVDAKKPHERMAGVQAGYFRMVRAAIEKVGYFDPAVDGPEDLDSGKQIFQRARNAIDVKHQARDGSSQWRLFKTVIVDNHAVYQFQPDPDFEFALIFLPRS